MVDAWVKQVLENGPRNYIATYTLNFSSTSAITNYVAADPTSSGDMGWNIGGNTLYPGVNLKIWELMYDMAASQQLQLQWDATSAQVAVSVNGQGSGNRNYKQQGGLYVPQSAGAPITGATGKIIFNTIGTVTAGDFISIQMWLKKDIQQ